jgi:hypothetical protein
MACELAYQAAGMSQHSLVCCLGSVVESSTRNSSTMRLKAFGHTPFLRSGDLVTYWFAGRDALRSSLRFGLPVACHSRGWDPAGAVEVSDEYGY